MLSDWQALFNLLLTVHGAEAAYRFGTSYLALEATSSTIPARNRVFCAAQCEVRSPSCLTFQFEGGVCSLLNWSDQRNLTLNEVGAGDGPVKCHGFTRLGLGQGKKFGPIRFCFSQVRSRPRTTARH